MQSKLKEITEDIKITETNLLDIASLVNYEIIQVSRQIIDTHHEMQKRRITIPNTDFLSSKSFESEACEVRPFQMRSLSLSLD